MDWRWRLPEGVEGTILADIRVTNSRGQMLARDRLPPSSKSNDKSDSDSRTESKIVADENMTLVRVNIGFDDGFKGRGAVAKKIAAMAGLNDGIVKEVEAKREYALLQATPDIAELLVERVDGAQIGKKIVSVANA